MCTVQVQSSTTCQHSGTLLLLHAQCMARCIQQRMRIRISQSSARTDTPNPGHARFTHKDHSNSKHSNSKDSSLMSTSLQTGLGDSVQSLHELLTAVPTTSHSSRTKRAAHPCLQTGRRRIPRRQGWKTWRPFMSSDHSDHDATWMPVNLTTA